ncbi:MAG: hypothetical protein LWY06_02530 [Firmicutes bacterium]|nr:hypothetical protein [Bacillota bacterium]
MKNRCLLITILMFFVCSVFSSFADTAKPKQILTKADLPDGYYLNSRNSFKTKKGQFVLETWSTCSNVEKKHYMDEYGNLNKLPKASYIMAELYYSNGIITDDIIDYYKGSVVNTEWKEITPKGKKYGDRFYYINRQSTGDDGLIKIIAVKNKSLCMLTIIHQKNSKYKSREDPEKLIETIYSRL